MKNQTRKINEGVLTIANKKAGWVMSGKCHSTVERNARVKSVCVGIKLGDKQS